MPCADTIRRGDALNWRLAVNGIHWDSMSLRGRASFIGHAFCAGGIEPIGGRERFGIILNFHGEFRFVLDAATTRGVRGPFGEFGAYLHGSWFERRRAASCGA